MNGPRQQPSLSILIAVTHLVGAGHLVRAAAIGRALLARGHKVTLATGGRAQSLIPMNGLDVVQLPPLQVTGTNYSVLCDPDGRPVDMAYLADRQERLRSLAQALRPHALVTELFPFGRRNLRAEFEALITAARRARPTLACIASVRDLPEPPRKPGRVAETMALVRAHYDKILVHGDPRILAFEESWPADPAFARRRVYTGYVREQGDQVHVQPRSGAEILVSGGTGEIGLPLFRLALRAAALRPGWRWHVLVGHRVTEGDFVGLLRGAPENALVERARPDFRALLTAARVSISLGGYNTMLDVVSAGVPALVVPFEDERETEQLTRAERFAALGLLQFERLAGLTPERLVAAIDHARPPTAHDVIMNGADRSAALIEEEVACRLDATQF